MFTPYAMSTAEGISTFCLSTVLSEQTASGYTPSRSIAVACHFRQNCCVLQIFRVQIWNFNLHIEVMRNVIFAFFYSLSKIITKKKTVLIFGRVRKNCEERLSASSCLSVRPSARNNSAPTGRIFMKFDI